MAALFFNRKKEHVIVCPACGRKIDKKETERNRYVCYECGAYFRVRAKNRVKMVADKDSFAPWFEELRTVCKEFTHKATDNSFYPISTKTLSFMSYI